MLIVMVVFNQIKNKWGLLKQTFNEFFNDNAPKLSAALAYYTVFSIAPMLFIVISLAGIFYGRDAVQGRLFGEIKKLVGVNAADQIQAMIANTQLQNNTVLGAIIGSIVLLLGATGVFTEIQDSINYIWSIKAKPSRGWVKYIVNRVLSFSLIVALGFILLASLVLNTLMDVLSDRIFSMFSESTFYLIYGLNLLIIFFIISLFFAVIYKVLPDAVIYWKDAFRGAMFTSFLFLLGKFLIGWYLGNSKMSAAYGAAASMIIILVWVYYTAMILYFGAEFTKVYALKRGHGIKPYKNAVYIIKEEKKEIPPFSIKSENTQTSLL